jgi:predicted regulator of Ras-like GTPase activity (Roadblock/LC7/MglB family)
MHEAFATVAKTEGVLGVVVFDDSGTCIHNDLPAPYESILVAEVVRRMRGAFDIFSSIEESEVSSFSVECEEGSTIMRKVDHYWILALARTNANLNMLNVALNVLALNLTRGNPGSGTALASRSKMTDSLNAHSSGRLSISNATSDIDIPRDAVDRALLQQLLEIYREYLGPAAKAVFKQQLAALGVTSRTLRRGQLGDLVARLTSKIPVPQRQKEFTSAVRQFFDRVGP